MKKIKDFFFAITHWKQLKELFIHVFNFKPNDKIIRGYKYAIYYGIFHYMKSEHLHNGMIDLRGRAKSQDDVIDRFSKPANRKQFLADLIDLRNNVEQANYDGFFSVACNDEQNKIEAEHYNAAMHDLNLMIIGTSMLPMTWWKVFHVS